MTITSVELTLSKNQIASAVDAMSLYEQLCRGDLLELVELARAGILVNYTASNEGILRANSEQILLSLQPIAERACRLLGYPPGARLTLKQLNGSQTMHLLLVISAILMGPEGQSKSAIPCYFKQNDDRHTLRLSVEQAYSLRNALDVYVRLSLGQLSITTEAVAAGHIRAYAPPGEEPPQLEPNLAWGEFNQAMIAFKSALGFPADGGYGIFHPNVHASTLCAWEVNQALGSCLFSLPQHDRSSLLRALSKEAPQPKLTDEQAPQVRVTPIDTN